MADAVITTLGSILVECGKILCGSVSFNIQSFLEFKSNVETLDKDIKSLVDVKKQIEEEIRFAEIDGGTRTIQVSMWLRKVEEIELVVNSILTRVRSNAQNIHGCCINTNCSLRCKMSRKVVKRIKEVQQLMDESSTHQVVMVDPRLKPIEQLPGPSITDQKTASENLAKILDLLKDDRVGTIGMLGMGGVGKTTLIRNLNNELESMDLEQPFSIVIWVTVSKKLDEEKVQDRIAERLNLKEIKGESMEGKAFRLFNRLKKEKRFIVILDDVWERIDLDRIGIPRPKDHAGCKIILTTRSVDICREMETDVQFSIAVLSTNESWDLFSQMAGETAHLEDIRPYAEAVARECGGLPLAIITVGKAMRGKTRLELWMDALRALRRSNPMPYIKGMEKEVYLPVKWSYDLLEGKNIKPCFLYCCLYPEDFSIEVNELLRCWLAEGLLDEQEDLEEAYHMGIALLENLKDLCLLETGYLEGTVRMHDVVRDVAVWIVSSSEDGCKSFIRSGLGLSKIPAVETWGSYNRISFMYNEIEMLPYCSSRYPQVSSLLLQSNVRLETIPIEFLRGFQTLKVLNLSETSITSLPELEEFEELRALLLRGCVHLKALPLRRIRMLQVLDLSGSCMEMSPDEATQLLRGASSLVNLLEFYVELIHASSISSVDSLVRRLRRSTISIGSSSPTGTYLTTLHSKVVYLCGLKSSSEEIAVLRTKANALVLSKCQQVNKMWTGVGGVGLDCLKSLTIDNCPWTASMGINDAQQELVLLPNLEALSLCCATNLSSISEMLVYFGTKIRIIDINNCHHLKSLFTFKSLHKLENLEEIYVTSCTNLSEIISHCQVSTNALPNLRIMEWKKLPTLKSVSQELLASLCLKRVQVEDCPLLKKLPLSSQHATTIEVIKGELTWWNQLQWDDADTKLRLQQHFQPL